MVRQGKASKKRRRWRRKYRGLDPVWKGRQDKNFYRDDRRQRKSVYTEQLDSRKQEEAKIHT